MTDSRRKVACPYKSLPASAYWRRAIASVPPEEIDPVTLTTFEIDAADRIATAGSCFAQHIARYIKNSGGSYFVTEPGHQLLPPDVRRRFNYGTFTARFGNVYTVRQLLQLLERAYGQRTPVDDVWQEEDSSLIDPFRPYIQPGGFRSMAEYEADRQTHFRAVRRMVEESDVFVFTLGLTEAWENVTDGTVYAICPGCGAGQHVEGESRFRNFEVGEVMADLASSIEFLRERNPGLRILLTVSPVPLIATFSPQHVLAATTYSKSVLRVAAQAMVGRFDHVDYFPSFEIITSQASRGAYFAEDLRDVEEVGVRHVMRTFFRHYCPGMSFPDEQAVSAPRAKGRRRSDSARVNDVICDEQQLEKAF
ncbi:MAG: GSCFA domain-containing protein [Geminicoccaceae bacterium]